jgi:hypothetical protein
MISWNRKNGYCIYIQNSLLVDNAVSFGGAAYDVGLARLGRHVCTKVKRAEGDVGSAGVRGFVNDRPWVS